MREPPAVPAGRGALQQPSLFRKEAVDAATTQAYGESFSGSPLRWPTLLALLPCCGLLVGLQSGSYTRSTGISGELVPLAGQLTVMSLQPGEIVGRTASEGLHVQAGDVLFELRSPRASAAQGATDPAIAALLQSRRASLLRDQQLQQRRELQRDSVEGSEREARLVELRQLESQLSLQRQRVALAEESVQRYTSLHRSGFVALLQLQERQADLLDQQQRLADQERAALALRHTLQVSEQERREQRWQAAREREATQRELDTLQEGELEAETRRAWLVRAPRAGVVSSVIAVAGQSVAAGSTLATLVPDPMVLEAELFAPSRAAGFLRPGLPVRLRYQAYPYQKFGLQDGRIREVSATALRADAHGEPVYRVRVSLARQALRVGAQWQPLKPGERVDANVLLETRRLYEWLLDPLYSLWSRS